MSHFGPTKTTQSNLLTTFQSALINLLAAMITKLDDSDCNHLLTFYHNALHEYNDYLLKPNEVLPADQQAIYLENKIALKQKCNELFEQIKQRYQKLTIQEFPSKGG